MFRIVLVLIFLYSNSLFGQVLLGDVTRNVHDIDVRSYALGAVTDRGVELWDLKEMALIKSINFGFLAEPTVMCFGLDTLTLVTGTRSGEILIWNMISGVPAQFLASGNQGAVTSMAVNVEMKLLAVGFSNEKISLYNLDSHSEIFSSINFSNDVTAVAFSRDNQWLLIGDGSGKVFRVSLQTKEMEMIYSQKKWITSLDLSADKKQFACATNAGRAIIIKNVNGSVSSAPAIIERNYNNFITSLDYHPTEVNSYCFGTVSGEIGIEIGNGYYTSSMRAIVNQVKFIPTSERTLVVAVAMRGRGLQIMKANEMKYKK